MERIEFYTDYRRYLKDLFAEKKKQHSFFSYRYFCQKAGITSTGLYKEVVSGGRNLTGRTIDAFVKGLGLSEPDALFFRALVHFNQTENEPEKVLALERLRGLKRKVTQEIVPLDMYEYFSNWYYPVIRELACILDWKGDCRILAQAVNPPLKKADAQNALKFLCDKGFLKIASDGKYVQSNPALSTGSEVSSIALRKFNELMARKGADALQQYPPGERDVRTLIIGASKKTFVSIKAEIREFIARVVRLVDEDASSDTVYSLNVQLFPLSTPPKQENAHHESE